MNKNLLSSLVVLALAGCANAPQSGNVYHTGEVGMTQNVRWATVQTVRPVIIDSGSTGVGMGTGAVVGGVAGATLLGGGNGKIVTGILGAVAGGIAGQAIENNTSQKQGLEIGLRLENGQHLVVVQPDDGARFMSGDRVRLVGNGSNARVTY